MDVGTFRSKHKTFYSRMKPASCHLGRRTGMHLRKWNNNNSENDNEGEDGSVGNMLGNGSNDGEEDGATSSSSAVFLCRYNKAGNKSIMYLDLGRVSYSFFYIVDPLDISLRLRRHHLMEHILYCFPPLCQLFDALFEIHVIELNHRGRDATKNLADERYANIPDGTVRAFLDNCPICNAKRRSSGGDDGGGGAGGHCSSFVDDELSMDNDDEV